MRRCRRVLVSGRVQGVFFRDSTRQVAARLGLTGWVRNLYDGRVEVLVCGPTEQLTKLVKWLEIGPKMANVSSIDSVDIDPHDETLLKGVEQGRFAILPDA